MDFIDGLDIELDKEFYYPGETISGAVLLSCVANVKIRGLAVSLFGVVQVQWKLVKNGMVYTVKNSRTLMDDRQIVLGQESQTRSVDMPVLSKGTHKVLFSFPLDESLELPSSFESKLGIIRYYVHAYLDIPYASPPQTKKHFSLIGGPKDNPPNEWLVPIALERHNQSICTACSHGSLSFEVSLDKTAFCCGENIPMRLEIVNGVNLKVWPVIQLIQRVDYCVDKTGFGIRRDAMQTVWEYKGLPVPKHSTMKLENLSQALQIPVMPPTTSTCDIIKIEYKLKVSLLTSKWGEPLHVTIPVLVTSYYQQDKDTKTILKPAEQSVIGGNYVSPELQTGAVYDGTDGEAGETIIYQPVYVCVPHKKMVSNSQSSQDGKLISTEAAQSTSNIKMVVSEGGTNATPSQSKEEYKQSSHTKRESAQKEVEISDCRVSSL